MQQKQEVRQTLSMTKNNSRPIRVDNKSASFPAKQRPSGGSKPLEHDKDLKRFKENNSCISITLMSGNIIGSAVIVGGDKYSIKIRTSSGDSTIFKHAIESFTRN